MKLRLEFEVEFHTHLDIRCRNKRRFIVTSYDSSVIEFNGSSKVDVKVNLFKKFLEIVNVPAKMTVLESYIDLKSKSLVITVEDWNEDFKVEVVENLRSALEFVIGSSEIVINPNGVSLAPGLTLSTKILSLRNILEV